MTICPLALTFLFPWNWRNEAAARAGNVLVLPAFPYGFSSHHRDFQMTITLEPNTLIRAIEDVCSSLIRNGINRILILNGHDGNIAPIELSARTIKERYPTVAIACLEAWWTLVAKTKNLFDDCQGLLHGGEAETSVMLSVRPDLVDMRYAPKKTIPKIPRNVKIYWRFSEQTKTGATGAPRHASRSRGDETLHILEPLILGFINDMEKNNWKYGLAVK